MRISVKPTEFFEKQIRFRSPSVYTEPFSIELEKDGTYWGLYNSEAERIDGAEMSIFNKYLVFEKEVSPLIKLLFGV